MTISFGVDYYNYMSRFSIALYAGAVFAHGSEIIGELTRFIHVYDSSTFMF